MKIMNAVLGLMMFSFFCCGIKNESKREDFVSKHYDENFSDFSNMSFLIRSAERNGELTLFVSTDLRNAATNGPYIINISKTGDIISTSCKLMQDSLSFNREKTNILSQKFLKYQVNRLGVDTLGNVLIGVGEIEKPDLIRFSDIKSIPEKYKNWKQIKGNWYESNNQ